MRRGLVYRSDLNRIVGFGASLMVLAVLLDSIINAQGVGVAVARKLFSPGATEFAVRLANVSLLLLFIAYVSSIMDRRKSLEKALLKYQAGMDASMDGILILNDKWECTYVNQSFARMHGYRSHKDVLGMSWDRFLDDGAIRTFESEILPRFLGKREWRGETVGRKKDGSTFPQELSIATIGRSSLVCITRDTTGQKQVERELETKARELEVANEELEAFGYSLTHDIRNNLTRVTTASQILKAELNESLDVEGHYLVKTIHGACQDMDRLINDMMVLSGILECEISREAVDLSEMAAGIAAALQESEPNRQAQFRIAGELVVQGDAKLLEIALENLFRNAWKYSGRKAQTRIEFGSVSRNGKRAFYVRDNGVGFDMKEADKLFKPFQRLGSARDFPGTGIGLTTVKRIVQRHRGEAWGEGEPGNGAAFFFTLPE